MDQKANLKIAFFGGEPLGVPTLTELELAGILPDLIVSSPDRKSGRGMKLQQPPVKQWAMERGIEVFQPTSYKNREAVSRLAEEDWDLFIVVAYNFILPKWVIEIPKKGVINVHPSLLPRLRGASPIRTAILENKQEDIGVTIMLMDEKMDHGPILDQAAVSVANKDWPLPGPELDSILAKAGGDLLTATIPAWIAGEIEPQEQDHEVATYTNRFDKNESELILNPHSLPVDNEAFMALCKIRAWSGIGDTFFIHNSKRIKVKTAQLSPSGSLEILSVIPAGKKEMSFDSYLQSLSS